MIIAPLIWMAAAAQLPTEQSSPLVEPGTDHEWVMLEDTDDGVGWYDRSFNDAILFEGQSYPVVLIRFILRREEADTSGDMVLAVDCAEQQMAVFAVWLQVEDKVIPFYDEPEGMIFDFTEPPFDATDITLFKQACGQEWTP